MLLPGVSGVQRFGFQPGNYVESTGQTLSAADAAVGLAVDAARVPGPNVAPALSPANWTVQNQDATHIITWQPGGGFRYQSDTISPVLTVLRSGVLAIGKTYEFIVTCSAYVSGGVKTDGLVGGPTIVSSAGTHRFIGVAQNPSINLTRSTTNVDLTISSLQVRELPGIHASQATAGFKPVVRRGLVNLQTHSTPTAGQWAASASGTGTSPTVTYNHATAPNGQSAARVQMNKGAGTASSDWSQFTTPNNTVTTGAVYSTALWMRTTDGVSTQNVAFRDGINFTTVAVTGEWQMFVRTGTTTGSVMAAGCRLRGTEGTDQTADILVANAGIFAGTVTAQEIIAVGGIPVTTTAPASSANGVQYWQFDGTDDRFSMTFPSGAGWNSTTIITARATGAVTETAQNVEGTHLMQLSGHVHGRMYVPNDSTLSASELATLQRFANTLSGYSA